MQLISDNTDRLDHLTTLLRICSCDILSQPLPQDMRDLLLALDVEAIEDDLRDALALGDRPEGDLRLVA